MAADPGPLKEAAPAKVNLYLQLRGRRADGYHLLDSLAVFPAVGDSLSAAPAEGLSLRLGGPFGGDLTGEGDNLVLRAARVLAQAHAIDPCVALHLEKYLPVASGIGGGSADAAAALRLLARIWGVALTDGLALELGADVPVCLSAPQPRLMAGIGEELSLPPPLPGFWMVLVNPGQAVATGAVFAALESRDNPQGPPLPSDGLADFAALTGWLGSQRNDLQPAATALCPAISEVLEVLSDAALTRMSGSGATCFALHERRSEAEAQAARLIRARPDWWVAATPVAAWPG
jgi:4-diphosphocytidyl-2-C-methyl-D-erythritol kinase